MKTANTAAEGALWAQRLNSYAAAVLANLASMETAIIYADNRNDEKALVTINGTNRIMTIQELADKLAKIGKLGEVYGGILADGQLDSLEPICEGGTREPYPEEDALDVLQDYLRSTLCSDFEISEETWGWSVRTDGEDDEPELNFCWRARYS